MSLEPYSEPLVRHRSSRWKVILTTMIVLSMVGAGYVGYSSWIETTYGSLSQDYHWPGLSNRSKPAMGPNLLSNGSIDQLDDQGNPQDWLMGNIGTNSATLSLDRQITRLGSYSLKASITNYTDGDVKWYFKPQSVQPLENYTYQNWYQSDVPTSLVAEYLLKDGSSMYQTLGHLDPSPRGWTEALAYFTTPPDVIQITVFHLINQSGSLWIDEVRLSTYQAEPLEQGMVSLTFDDGSQSVYDHAFEVMNRYDMPATHYVLAGSAESTEVGGSVMGKSEIRALMDMGHEIGSHTISHPNLRKIPHEVVNHELKQSRHQLQLDYRQPVINFAAPYGEYSNASIAASKQWYRSHRSVDAGFNDLATFDPYNIRVQHVRRTTSVDMVSSWIQYAKQERVWLVLVFHEIDDLEGPYGYAPADFERIVASISESQIQAVTVNQALDIIAAQLSK